MTTTEEVLDSIAGMTLFADLTAPQLEAVAHQFEERLYPPGERIVRQGVSGNGLEQFTRPGTETILEPQEYSGGKGQVVVTPAGSIEHIQLNNTDPWHDVDGERSSLKSKHPYLSEPAVRDALNLLVDRGSVHKFIYGRTGDDSANFLIAPEKETPS